MSRPKPPARDEHKICARYGYWIAGNAVRLAVDDGWADVVFSLFDRIEKALTGDPNSAGGDRDLDARALGATLRHFNDRCLFQHTKRLSSSACGSAHRWRPMWRNAH